MSLDIGDRVQLAMSLDVLRSCAQHEMLSVNLTRDQARIFVVSDTYYRIKTFVYQIDSFIAQAHLYVEQGVRGQQAAQYRDDLSSPVPIGAPTRRVPVGPSVVSVMSDSSTLISSTTRPHCANSVVPSSVR